MFGIGPMELVVIALLTLVVVGPARLPQLMRQIGKFVVYARRYSSDLRNEFNQVIRDAETEMRIDEAQKLREQIQKELKDAGNLLEAKPPKDQGEATSLANGEAPPQHHSSSPHATASFDDESFNTDLPATTAPSPEDPANPSSDVTNTNLDAGEHQDQLKDPSPKDR